VEVSARLSVLEHLSYRLEKDFVPTVKKGGNTSSPRSSASTMMNYSATSRDGPQVNMG
ncbi:unnamed protein product, partial [Amoebophrya sp. A25]